MRPAKGNSSAQIPLPVSLEKGDHPVGVSGPSQSDVHGTSGMRRHILPLDNDINTEYGLGQQSEDTISLMPGQREKDSLGLLSDNEDAISCSSSDSSVTDNRNFCRFRQYLVGKKIRRNSECIV